MKKIIAHYSIDYRNPVQEEELEFSDDATAEEIEKEIYEWAHQGVTIWWREK